MSNLTQGSNGVELRFIIKDEDGVIVPLTGATVTVKFRKTIYEFTKPCTIISDVGGEVQVDLMSDDLNIGDCYYYYQFTVSYPSGKLYRSLKDSFYVEAMI